MLTDDDVQKLLNLLATKEDVKEIEGRLDGLQEATQSLVV